MARPVLAIPFLTGTAELTECIASIDTDVRLLVINNSDTDLRDLEGRWERVIDMPNNIGYSASVNLAIKAYPQEAHWLIANHDVVFAPGDLDRLAEEMTKVGPRWVGINDWRVFGINSDCIERVGFWDENFHPAYCEDADYEYRCTLAGVRWYHLEGGTTHVGSASIREPRYRDGNARSYPANRDYFRRKWGGGLRGGETYTTPFGEGGSVAAWTLDPRRLREQAW